MKKQFKILLIAAAVSQGLSAQSWHEGDIQWINSTDFASNVNKWSTSYKLTDDDNFFISRVRPKMRFTNRATQVREDLVWMDNDHRLLAWIPMNTHSPGDSRDCLPTGVFDQEVFTMWSYVDHWGDWTAPMGQIPATLSDVAHKNGVAVSSVASIPFGAMSYGDTWYKALTAIATNCTSATKAAAWGAKAAKMLAYYGHDGVGYNSEFTGFPSSYLGYLRNFHQYLHSNLKTEYQKVVPEYNMQENVWYDGTNDRGTNSFDQGLGSHNSQTWGPLGSERTSLFFNYNWVTSRGTEVLTKSEENAADATYGKGRNPLYLYCGLNMQGGEPSASRNPWATFAKHKLSIGLWGQHKVNMFFEGRGSNGTRPEVQQATYQSRIQTWFTGSTHNPVNVPTTLSGATVIATDDDTFHGMSTFMSARSTLSWDLTNEAFITYFNTGNGKYFNWYGERQNDNEWYNLGVQDYMPTWRWWWTSKFLGKEASDVPAEGLKAAISWDDAWVGGSTIAVTGNTTAAEYLHLFKTNYALQAGDIIKFVYKLAGGKTDASMVFSVNGSESTVANEFEVCTTSQLSDDSEWISKSYTVTDGDGLAGKNLAVIGLKFANSQALNMYLGEISIKRGTLTTPSQPTITKAQVLRSHYAGLDAKIIFEMANTKEAGTVCYNDDVNTSLFKIWSREEGKEPVLLGITTSWAAMAYSVPFNGDESGNGRVAFGVEAVSMDHQSTSGITWTNEMSSGKRVYSDQINVDKTTIIPDETFTLKAVDPKISYKWEVWTSGENSTKVTESDEVCNAWECTLPEIGTYNVQCRRDTLQHDTFRGDTLLNHNAFLVVTDPGKGCLPEIYSITANESTTSIEVVAGDQVKLEYTGRPANGVVSRGIQLNEKFFGVQAKELFGDADNLNSFSIAGWLKITNFPVGGAVWIDIRRYDGASWPRNNWGWLWTDINPDGTLMGFHHDMTQTDGSGGITNPLVYDFQNGKKVFFNPGGWTHFAFTFDRSSTKCRSVIYINGQKVESKWGYFTGTGDDYIADLNNTNKTPAQSGTTEDYVTAAKTMNKEAFISICGTRHTGRGGGLGFSGVLDDFQVWGCAMNQEQVNQSMAGLDGKNLPSEVLAYWDFEPDTPINTDLNLNSKGSSGAKGGYYSLASGASEGEGVVTYEQPMFVSGCPFIEGADYKVETTPSWKINKVIVSDVTGNDQAGSAKATMEVPGEYTAKLTLSNDLGEHSKEFNVIKVNDKTQGIGDVVADPNEGMRTYTVDDVMYLEVASDGDYTVEIFNTAGIRMAAKSQHIDAGSYMRLSFGGEKGVYLVNVRVDGRQAKTFKVVKK